MKNLKVLLLILFLLVAEKSFSAVGCKVIGGTTIYPTYNTYLLGVIVNGINIGIPSDVYWLNNPISTNVSCTVAWANNYQVTGSCVYGTPAVALPPLVSVCTNCVAGELVNYTTTLQCNLDDYSWALGATAAGLGFVFIRRRKNNNS
ncbi:hypothetical protein [Pedobacter aquatilis]|uniref:hypothetical protein n=1 Tax=Pedobacter aquatilis TaxID=351343 RepID=UPI0029306470|nr:hypothetical protein [Pedobacter aquatilis]